MANTMGGTESNAQEEQERRKGRQPARDGGEGRPVSTEPVGTRPRIRLPEPLDPAPAFSSSCSLLGTRPPVLRTCPARPAQGRKEEEEEEGKKRKGKESALLSMLPYQLDIDNTTPSVINIVLGPIYYTVPMHGVDIPM